MESSENRDQTRRPGAESDGFEPVRARILPHLLEAAAFDGWTGGALDRAGAAAGVDRAALAAAFPQGAADALKYWSIVADEAMETAMAGPEFAALKVREKVSFAVKARLAALRPHKEAARRAAAALALPIFGGLGAALAWRTADAIWRAMGDRSADFNFYSKRMILSGVWLSTLTRWLGDDSADEAATEAFLAARIEDVMKIEKAKAKIRELNIDPARPVEWLAKLRFGSR